MNTKLIIFNGPKECGKDSSAKYVQKKYPSGTINLVSIKKPLFEMVLSLFPIDRDEFFRCYNDRELKESPHKDLKITDSAYVRLCRVLGINTLLGYYRSNMVSISPRNALIYVSECMVKPTFGDDIFGQLLLSQIKEGVINIETSGGFPEELHPAINLLGKDNVSIVKIYRPNYDFSGDSRRYLPEGITTYQWEVWNTGSEEDFNNDVLNIVETIGHL